MFGLLFRAALLAVLAFGGWIVGTLYPAPAELVERVYPRAFEQRAMDALQRVDWQRLEALVTEEQLTSLRSEALHRAAAAGSAIMVEHSDDFDVADNPALVEAAPIAARESFETALALCPRMSVTNAPAADAARQVTGYRPVVDVQGVALAINPTRGACLSSSYGQRSGRLHKGVDYHSAEGGAVMAGGDGAIVEMKYRDDYGNMILIDHGNGVFTRYAHLSTFQRGLAVGGRVAAGDVIGLMGNTASYAIPIHLHYEVLLGDYNTQAGSFGLAPHDPFSGLRAG